MTFEDVENARKKCLYKILTGIILGLALVIIAILIGLIVMVARGVAFSLSSMTGMFPVILCCFLGVTIITAIQVKADFRAYRKAYKGYFVEKSLAKTFTIVKYDHDLGLASFILKSTQMIDVGDRYNSNDLTIGKYKDVLFKQADVHIEKIRINAGDNTSYTTLFKGRFMIFEFPKNFNYRVQVVEKGFGASIIPKSDQDTGRAFKKIQLESAEFNSIYNVFAEDDFETFYLLDPSMIDKLTEMNREYKGKLLFCFIDNQLIVGLKDGKDAFEPPSIFKSIDEDAESKKVENDIRLITDFVDQLKLNRKAFK